MTGATATAGAVHPSLRGQSVDWRGYLFQGTLLLCLLLSLLVLVTLIADVLTKGLPVFFERGTGFLTSPMSNSASRAGVAQGILGSVLIAVIVSAVAFPLGIMTAVYLE